LTLEYSSSGPTPPKPAGPRHGGETAMEGRRVERAGTGPGHGGSRSAPSAAARLPGPRPWWDRPVPQRGGAVALALCHRRGCGPAWARRTPRCVRGWPPGAYDSAGENSCCRLFAFSPTSSSGTVAVLPAQGSSTSASPRRCTLLLDLDTLNPQQSQLPSMACSEVRNSLLTITSILCTHPTASFSICFDETTKVKWPSTSPFPLIHMLLNSSMKCQNSVFYIFNFVSVGERKKVL